MNNKTNDLSDILHTQYMEILKGNPIHLHFHCTSGETFHHLAGTTLKDLKENYFLLSHQLKLNDLKEPYEPFLNLIYQTVKKFNIDIPELIDTSNVYPTHKILFSSYLQGIIPIRKDELILGELPYEINQLQRSLARILSQLSKRAPIIMAISNLQFADGYTLDFIKRLRNYLGKCRILFLFCYNKDYYFSDEDQHDTWSNFITYSEETHGILDLYAESFDKGSTCTNSNISTTEEDSLRLSLLNLNFLTFTQAIKCAIKAKDFRNGQNIKQDKEFNYTILQILGDSYYYLGENDNALTYYRALSEEAHKNSNYRMLSEGYRKSALTHINKYDLDTASKLSSQSLKFAQLSKDEYQVLKVYYLEYLISDRTTQPMDKDKYFLFLDLLLKYELESTYAYCLKNAYLYAAYYTDVQELHALCDKGIEISKKNQNEYALSVDYHKKGIIYSYNENYESAIKYYMKSQELRLKLGNTLHLVQIYNGIGYLYMITEKYKDAHSYYQKSIRLLSKVHDYNEVSATLCNFSFLLMLSRNYKECIKVIDKLLLIMKIFNMTYLPYRSITDIYILKAFCHYKQGELFKTYDLTNRVDSFNAVKLTSNFKFLYNILKGLINASHHHHEAAINLFDEALSMLDSSNQSSKSLLPMFYLEFGTMLLSIGEKSLGYQKLSEGLIICNEKEFEFHRQLISTALEGISITKAAYALPKVALNLEALVEIAKQEVTLNKLQKKIREIEFLNRLQELSSLYSSKTSIAEKYLDLIFINFPVDIGFLHFVEDNKFSCLSSRFASDSKFIEPIEYINELNSKGEPVLIDFVNSRTPEGIRATDLKFVINIPISISKTTSLNLFLATIKTQNNFVQDDLNVLSISMKQMGTILTKVEQDLSLLQMTRTDILTGLNNRQALQSALNNEISRMVDQNNCTSLSIMFIDLDNFKYYNDTFGHNLGDIIIKSFAQLLKQTFRKSDFIARFGGDEFVIILLDTPEEKAKLIAERLISKITESDNFKNIISQHVGHPVEIPSDKLLSCSIGISGYSLKDAEEINLNTLLNYADQAQYKAKSFGKNAIIIY